MYVRRLAISDMSMLEMLDRKFTSEGRLMDIKQIMSTQLTETEVMVYLLVINGATYRDIELMPFGFTYETARNLYERAKIKFDKFNEIDLFSTDIKRGRPKV